MLYPINRNIRYRSIEDAEAVFDKALIQKLEEKEVIREGEIKKVSDLFRYERFQRAENRWTNFSKYVLMRIDRHLCSLLDKPSYANGDLEELEGRFNKTTRRRYVCIWSIYMPITIQTWNYLLTREDFSMNSSSRTPGTG